MMNKEEFISEYCEKSDMRKVDFDSLLVALPCACGIPDCKGWAAVSNNNLSITAHNELYGPEEKNISPDIT